MAAELTPATAALDGVAIGPQQLSYRRLSVSLPPPPELLGGCLPLLSTEVMVKTPREDALAEPRALGARREAHEPIVRLAPLGRTAPQRPRRRVEPHRELRHRRHVDRAPRFSYRRRLPIFFLGCEVAVAKICL